MYRRRNQIQSFRDRKVSQQRFKAYNPAQPDDLNTWDFPVSPLVSVIKPDGN
jgi:hypothetical protein